MSGARLEAWRLGEDALHERVALFGGRALQCQQPSQRLPGAVWRDATGVREQLADAHVPVGRLDLCRELREGLTDRGLERHQLFLGERANQGCGDGLGQRPEVHPVCRRNQVAFTDPAFAADVNPRRAIAPDDDGSQAGQCCASRSPLTNLARSMEGSVPRCSCRAATALQVNRISVTGASMRRIRASTSSSAPREVCPERELSRPSTTRVEHTGRHRPDRWQTPSRAVRGRACARLSRRPAPYERRRTPAPHPSRRPDLAHQARSGLSRARTPGRTRCGSSSGARLAVRRAGERRRSGRRSR